MTRFLLKLSAFLVLQAAIAFGVLVSTLSKDNPHHYLAAGLDKKARLERTSGGRIIFVGGSATAFGVVSAEVERLTGRASYNHGLHAGLGIPYMLSEVAALAKAGDLLVLSPEYEFAITGDCRASVVARMTAIDPGSLAHLNGLAWKRVLDEGNLNLLTACARRAVPTLPSPGGKEFRVDDFYRREAFDDHGDCNPKRMHHQTLQRDSEPLPYPDSHAAGARLIERFTREMRDRGVEVWLWPPPIERRVLDLNHEQIDELIRTWMGIEGASLVNLPGDEIYETSECFDTAYHLTGEAALKRTRHFVQAYQQRAVAPSPRSADFQVCCFAGFQAGRARHLAPTFELANASKPSDAKQAWKPAKQQTWKSALRRGEFVSLLEHSAHSQAPLRLRFQPGSGAGFKPRRRGPAFSTRLRRNPSGNP